MGCLDRCHEARLGLVDRLDMRDLVVREADEVDRRKTWVMLTDEGSEVVKQVKGEVLV